MAQPGFFIFGGDYMDNGMALYDEPVMTIKQVSDALGVDSETIRVWIRKLYPGLIWDRAE